MRKIRRQLMGGFYVSTANAVELLHGNLEGQWLCLRNEHTEKESAAVEKGLNYLVRAARVFRVIGNRMSNPSQL